MTSALGVAQKADERRRGCVIVTLTRGGGCPEIGQYCRRPICMVLKGGLFSSDLLGPWPWQWQWPRPWRAAAVARICLPACLSRAAARTQKIPSMAFHISVGPNSKGALLVPLTRCLAASSSFSQSRGATDQTCWSRGCAKPALE